MFCDEKIIAVYEGRLEYNTEHENAFFDCFHDIAFHTTRGYRYILETEHYFISVGYSGVEKLEKKAAIDEIEKPGEWIDPCTKEMAPDSPPWVSFESTLFVGERLVDVRPNAYYYEAVFDDFTLKVIPYENGDEIHSLDKVNHFAYNHMYGFERLIKRKCDCGGEGELLMDFVSDCVVRCKACKKSTWARMNVQDAIDDWENGETPCDSRDIVIE